MAATIRVRGTGRVSLKPDTAEISLELVSKNADYGKAAEGAAYMLGALKTALGEAGFDEDDIKTSSFSIYTQMQGFTDADGRYSERFAGYACSHRLMISFPMDAERLALTIDLITQSCADPHLNVRFTVEDKDAAICELLRDCAAQARKKAEVLCAASGAELGELLGIDYQFADAYMYSQTDYCVEANETMPAAGAPRLKNAGISPRDIELTDSAVFTWAAK